MGRPFSLMKNRGNWMNGQLRHPTTWLALRTLAGLSLAAGLALSAMAVEVDRPQEPPDAELSALLTRHVRDMVAHSPGLPIEPHQWSGPVEVWFYPKAGWMVIHLGREFLPETDPVENEDFEHLISEDAQFVLGDAFPVRRFQVLYGGRSVHSYFPRRGVGGGNGSRRLPPTAAEQAADGGWPR